MTHHWEKSGGICSKCQTTVLQTCCAHLHFFGETCKLHPTSFTKHMKAQHGHGQGIPEINCAEVYRNDDMVINDDHYQGSPRGSRGHQGSQGVKEASRGPGGV